MISIVVTTYNHEKYIAQCLDSILMQQTSFPFEIILGEDKSSDTTREICKQYAKQYPDKIKLFLRSRKDVIYINGNATGRFNFLENVKAAKGKYIALCEGDDYWTDPLKLQKQVDLLENKTNLIACHHWQKIAVEKEGAFIEKDAPKNGHGYFAEKVATVKHIFNNQVRVKTRTLMFRNIINAQFFPSWIYKVAFGDVPLSYLLGQHGDFGFIDEEMAVYRQTNVGVSTAGLKELGAQKFRVQHMKNWIEIWDYADKLYKHKYHKEASKTVSSFYQTIFLNLPITFKTVSGLFLYNIFTRNLSVVKTFAHTKQILLFYGKHLARKIKNK